MGARTAWIVAIVLVVGGVVGFGARAATAGGDAPAGRPSRTVTVSATAAVGTAPNEAVATLGVRSEAASGTGAMDQNAARMRAVLKALDANGIAPADVKTVDLSLYRQQVGRGSSRHEAFVASEQVQVTDHRLQSIGAVIDAAVRAGATSVQGISFQVSNPDQVQATALGQAIRAARTKADALAAAAGTRVVRVVTISQDNYQPPVYNQPLFGKFASSAVPTPVLPPASVRTSVTVQVVWELE